MKSNRIIAIDSYRAGGLPPEPEPQSVGTKRIFHGNQGTDAAVRRMFRVWSRATARCLRIAEESVDGRVSDLLLEERYRRAA